MRRYLADLLQRLGLIGEPPAVVKEAKAGYTYVFEGHDQSKGAQAFARSKAEALTIRRQARIDSRDVLHRVK